MALQEYVTSGFVHDGELHIRNRRGLDRAMAQMRKGEVVITIARRHAIRSLEASAYYWSVPVRLVAEHTGHSPDEIHEIFKAMFLPKHLAVTDGNGEIQGEFVIGGTTTKLNKPDFYDFVQRCREWAREKLSVETPDPDPDFKSKRGRRAEV